VRLDGGVAEVEAFEHQRHDVALGLQRGFDLAAEPVAGFVAAFERRGREDDDEVRAGDDVAEDGLFEVAGAESVEVEEGVVAVLGEVLKERERPREIRAAVADEDGFLDGATHGSY